MVSYSVIVHVNEIERWPIALNNIRNLLNDAGAANVRVELVANGPAVLFYADETAERIPSIPDIVLYRQGVQDMHTLYDKGIRFIACANALKMTNIAQAQLLPFVDVVPAGITEIVKKQAEGYAYVKP